MADVKYRQTLGDRESLGHNNVAADPLKVAGVEGGCGKAWKRSLKALMSHNNNARHHLQ
jgi:hypothetical protein